MNLELSDASSIKTLARVFQVVSKIGDELMVGNGITGGRNRVDMRTLNSSHSTSGRFMFKSDFFDKLTITSALDVKVNSRSFLQIFRNASSIRTVSFLVDEDEFEVVIQTKRNLIKRYYIPILEGSRIGVAIFTKDETHGNIQVYARFFLEVLQNFASKLDEITIAPLKDVIKFVSFTNENTAGGMTTGEGRTLRTEYTILEKEFDRYLYPQGVASADEYDNERNLTVFCKYLRSVTEFFDHFDAPMQIWFQQAGTPILLDLDVENSSIQHFEASFIFATRHLGNNISTSSTDLDTATSSGATNALLPTKTPSQENTSQKSLQYTSQVPKTRRKSRKVIISETNSEQTRSQPPNSQPNHQSNIHETPQDQEMGEPQPENHRPTSSHTPSVVKEEETMDLDTTQSEQQQDADIPPVPPTSDRTPLALRQRSFISAEGSASKSKSGADSPMPDESIPETPASQPHPRLAMFHENADMGESDEDEDSDSYVEGTPPPE